MNKKLNTQYNYLFILNINKQFNHEVSLHIN